MEYKDEILFEAKGNIIMPFIFRLILLFWIIFAFYKWEINALFFGISIVVAVLIILFIFRASIIVRKNDFEIKSECWVPFFSSSFQCDYSEISDISYEKGESISSNILFVLLEFLTGLIGYSNRNRCKINVKTIKDETFNYSPIISEKDIITAVELINKQVLLASHSSSKTYVNPIDKKGI